MEQKKIDRINELARKARTQGLTEAEISERDALRKEYIASVKSNLTAQLDSIYIQDETGKTRKLKRR